MANNIIILQLTGKGRARYMPVGLAKIEQSLFKK